MRPLELFKRSIKNIPNPPDDYENYLEEITN